MFNFFGNSVSEQDKFQYIHKIQELQEQVKILKTRLDNINEGTYNAPFGLDFSLMNAFSIERLVQAGDPVTVIGYVFTTEISDNSSKKEIREWTLRCSEKTHEELVKEFTKYKLK